MALNNLKCNPDATALYRVKWLTERRTERCNCELCTYAPEFCREFRCCRRHAPDRGTSVRRVVEWCPAEPGASSRSSVDE